MKLQAAIGEAVLAASLLVLSSTAITAIAYNAAWRGKALDQQVNSVYDLFRIMQYNASYAHCMIDDTDCAEAELMEVKSVYRLGYIGAEIEGLGAHAGNSTVCESRYMFCEPIRTDGYKIMCIYTCAR